METLEELLKNLGLSNEEVKKIKELKNIKEIENILNTYRKEYLNNIHEDEKKISLIDYILYKTRKGNI